MVDASDHTRNGVVRRPRGRTIYSRGRVQTRKPQGPLLRQWPKVSPHPQRHISALGLNAAKNINYIKKFLEQKLLRIKFPTKRCINAEINLK